MDDCCNIEYLGFIQHHIFDADNGTDRTVLAKMLDAFKPPPRTLLLLPELWACGFAYSDILRMQGEMDDIFSLLHAVAARYDILLAGSLPEQIDGKSGCFHNVLRVFGADRTYGGYSKVHLFPGEEKTFAAGQFSPKPIITPWGSLGCAICYDLRFPYLFRSLAQQGAKILVCCAQWPKKRIEQWRSLVIGRAIENQSFVVACNGVGRAAGIDLGGGSLVVSPAGEVIRELDEESGVGIGKIDWSVLSEARSLFKSFALNAGIRSGDKILSFQTCLSHIKKRSAAGQRVLFINLAATHTYDLHIQKLETLHLEHDFLVVGVGGDGIHQNEHNRPIVLQRYAALASVGAVVDSLGTWPEQKRKLRNATTIKLLEW